MTSQLARFRRGDDLYVVAAWALEPPPEDVSRYAPIGSGDAPAGGTDTPPTSGDDANKTLGPPLPEAAEAALFLVDPEGRDPVRHDAALTGEASGAATARAPVGGYLASLEVLDRDGRRAWRRRMGVRLDPRHPDVVALSDLLLLAPEGSAGVGEPAVTDEASMTGEPAARAPPLDSLLPRALPAAAFQPGPVEVVWEVYGLTGEEGALAFRLKAVREDRGALRRIGERLGLVSEPSPVALEWEEGLPDGPSPGEVYRRRVVLDLSALEPGSHLLTLSLSLPGRTPARATRRIELLEAPGL